MALPMKEAMLTAVYAHTYKYIYVQLCMCIYVQAENPNKMMTLTQCAQCFVQIQHDEVIPCLWCAHCAPAFDMYSFCDQTDAIGSVCAMFCANPAC